VLPNNIVELGRKVSQQPPNSVNDRSNDSRLMNYLKVAIGFDQVHVILPGALGALLLLLLLWSASVGLLSHVFRQLLELFALDDLSIAGLSRLLELVQYRSGLLG
jgi:ABC-type multidrug transport system permease subunit